MALSTSRTLSRVAVLLAAAWALTVGSSFALTLTGWHGFRWPEQYYAVLSMVPIALAGGIAVACYGLQSRLGRAALAATVGSIVWSSGDLVYTWHSTCHNWPIFACAHVVMPGYPSVADVGYLVGPVFWSMSAVLMWRAVGVQRGDVVGMAWIPAVAAVFGAWLILPTFGHVLGIPIGADLLIGPGYTDLQIAFTIVYVAVDVLILASAAILLRRSMGFAPFQFAVVASLALYVADITYNSRIAGGAYNPDADISDAVYAISIFFLFLSLYAIARAGLLERERRSELLARTAALTVESPS